MEAQPLPTLFQVQALITQVAVALMVKPLLV
jgi:hypothetical protein